MANILGSVVLQSTGPEEVGLRGFSGLIRGILFIVFLLLVAALIASAIALARIVIQRLQVVNAARIERKRLGLPAGHRDLPYGRGICNRCQGAYEMVFFLPSGERVCRHCYLESLPPAPSEPSEPNRRIPS
ncbi:MAG: hypothetical protein JW810_09340 [Sedimentisphaerales bacterium]|nr:hypothetical protein [Sedimentisphaerales bacterium]